MDEQVTAADETTVISYEFNLTCGCIQPITVDAETYEPVAGAYICPDCGSREEVPGRW